MLMLLSSRSSSSLPMLEPLPLLLLLRVDEVVSDNVVGEEPPLRGVEGDEGTGDVTAKGGVRLLLL